MRHLPEKGRDRTMSDERDRDDPLPFGLGRLARRVGGLVEDVQAQVRRRTEGGLPPDPTRSARCRLDVSAHAEAVSAVAGADAESVAWGTFAARWAVVVASVEVALGVSGGSLAPLPDLAEAASREAPGPVRQVIDAARAALESSDPETALDVARRAVRHVDEAPAPFDRELTVLAVAARGLCRARAGDRMRALRDLEWAAERHPPMLAGPAGVALACARGRLLLDGARPSAARRALATTIDRSPSWDDAVAAEIATCVRGAVAGIRAFLAAAAADRRAVAARLDTLRALDSALGARVGADCALVLAHRLGVAAKDVADELGVSLVGLDPRRSALAELSGADPRRRPPPSEPMVFAELDPWRELAATRRGAARSAVLAEACHVAVRGGVRPSWLVEAVAADPVVSRWCTGRAVVRPRADEEDGREVPPAWHVPGVVDLASPLADPDLAASVDLLAAWSRRASDHEPPMTDGTWAAVHGAWWSHAGGSALPSFAVGDAIERLLPFGRALAAAAAYATGPAAQAARETSAAIAGAGEVARGAVRVVFAGGFSSGKSSLVDALCGRTVLPVGTLPTTSTICEVSTGSRDRATIVARDGSIRPVAVEDVEARLRNLDAEAVREIAYVAVELEGIPWSDLVLYDLPGFDALEPYHASLAQERLAAADVVVWVVPATTGISREDEARIANLVENGQHVIVAVNKIDVVAEADRPRLVAHVSERVPDGVRVVPVSAKEALDAVSQGAEPIEALDAFGRAFEHRVVAQGRAHKAAAARARLVAAARHAQAGLQPADAADDLGLEVARAALARFAGAAAAATSDLAEEVAAEWTRALLAAGLVRPGSSEIETPSAADLRYLAASAERRAADRSDVIAMALGLDVAEALRWAEAMLAGHLRAAFARLIGDRGEALCARLSAVAGSTEAELRRALAAAIAGVLADGVDDLEDRALVLEIPLRRWARLRSIGPVAPLLAAVAALAPATCDESAAPAGADVSA
ncbi:MAG: hypothetical protein D6705_01615 [Deltaproteobacteria bacterium]|nr:MAG: hypothetical protein D6705_01615 [Deltaproteobacteria bacterium]